MRGSLHYSKPLFGLPSIHRSFNETNDQDRTSKVPEGERKRQLTTMARNHRHLFRQRRVLGRG